MKPDPGCGGEDRGGGQRKGPEAGGPEDLGASCETGHREARAEGEICGEERASGCPGCTGPSEAQRVCPVSPGTGGMRLGWDRGGWWQGGHPEPGLWPRSLSTCWERTALLPKGGGAARPQGQRQAGAEEGAMAGSLMAPKKKHKTGELWGDINRAVRH